ncbi:PREDICTED: uncharacterized protein LOC104801387 [Tarenaya hassleriana]|uniref:uncharacterized protein LOC104801387 n=1 Tax=Tarenaya hassleriana TaxID=28532 RepID=UPI00053C6326|nr:PREDICTED: uncharacterized protein LOC104801387 [Tarenaya hassleriana]XP_010522952.1 PREDICTED: uncharacterized protein LOC104801387 [Tarenaya hassleriana]
MAEENVFYVKQMIAEENDFDAKATMTFEDMIPAVDEESTKDGPPPMSEGQRVIPEIHEVLEQPVVNLRRHSTGVIDMRPGKTRVQPRYLRNHVSSTHDVCKHGKRLEDDVVKPWKLARKKGVEGEGGGKTDASGVRRKSLGDGYGQILSSRPKKPENCPPAATAKREVMVVEKPCVSLNAESTRSKEDSDIVRSTDGSSVKRSGQIGKNKETENSPSDSAMARKVSGVRNERTKTDAKKVQKVGSTKSSKDENAVSSLKKVKTGQKTKTELSSNEDVPEKTLYVVESSVEKRSVKGIQGEIQQPSGRKITGITGNNMKVSKHVPSSSSSLEDKGSRTTKLESRLTRSSSRSKTSRFSPNLHKRKESVSANLGADLKPESKNKPRKVGIKVTPLTRQLSFKRGKVLEPKSEDSTPTWIKFRRRVTPESSKTKSDGRKKSLRDKRDSGGKSNSTEGKPEKVVLRHRKVETKKKLQTLFNNVIEETASKLAEVRKSKVKALVGAFETVISLQDNKKSQKLQSQATTSTL